jgi:Holliday junction resolvase RusA-like endonuclease
MNNEYHPNLDEYEITYGALPVDQGELISHLENLLKLDPIRVAEEEKRISEIKWIEKEFTFFIIPKGTPRPRTDGNHFYVKGASQLHRIFKKFLREEGVICTRIEYELRTYQPTPTKSMSKMEILLCEKGVIRPIATPDWDNLAKTYTDCLQDVMLLNDNIINPGKVEKFYSIKPRIVIRMRWQKEFDSRFNEKKTKNSTGYRKLFGTGSVDDGSE